MIIGLCGEKQSGKDTVAAYLVKEYQFERRAFADPLKKSVAALLGIPFHLVDQLKNDERAHVAVGYVNDPPKMVQWSATLLNGGIARCDYPSCQDPHMLEDERHMHPEAGSPNKMWSPVTDSQTFRSFLQRYGTESHRDVFGHDFWLNHTLPKDAYYVGRNVVVTDVRFENEAERIREVGGTIVRVKRDAVDTTDLHVSEQINFEPDYVLPNNGTFDDLWQAVEDMLILKLV